MKFVFPIIVCLTTLGVTNGEFLTNAENGLLTNEARRLLYVVGTYPEWQQKIVNFKRKWGNQGEKYLNQKNVYIHGDILHSNEQQRRQTEPDKNISFASQQHQQNAPKNTTNLTRREFAPNSEMKIDQDLKWNKYFNNRKKALIQKHLENSNERLKDSNEPTRRYSNIDRIYRWLYAGRKQNDHSIKDSLEDEIHPNNLRKNMFGSIITDIPEKQGLTIDVNARPTFKYLPRYIVQNLQGGSMRETNLEKYPDKIETPYSEKIYPKITDLLRPNQADLLGPNQAMKPFAKPEYELKWVKEVLIPKLLSKMNEGKIKDHIHVPHDSSSENEEDALKRLTEEKLNDEIEDRD